MSYQPFDQTHPLPQVFVVDGRGSQTHPSMIPTWSFPQAQDVLRKPGKSRGCMGVSSRLAMVVLLLFALVFTSLGMGAVWTVNLQKELKELRKMVKAVNKSTEELAKMDPIIAPQKQIGLYGPVLNEEKSINEQRPAAHVIGRYPQSDSSKTLRWNWSVSRAFTSGAVVYRPEDGALQVNQTGLYYIYCRVEFLFGTCDSSFSFNHTVFVRRPGHSKPLTLMEAHRKACSFMNGAHTWTSESYMGSVHRLMKDDRVLVNVSHPHLLTHKTFANFFGLFMV